MRVSNNGLQNVKIARVSTVSFFVDTQLRAQISALVHAGMSVTIVASEDKLTKDIPDSDYVSINIPRKVSVFKDLLALLRLFLLFRRSSFDIVHSTTPKAGLLCSLAARLAGVPVRLHTFTGQPWVGLRGIKYVLSKGSDKLITYLNTHCYTDSVSQKIFLVDSGVSSAERISVLGSGSLAGIDLMRFNPLRLSSEDNKKLRTELDISLTTQVLLFVGRISRDKGVVELLQAYQKLMVDEFDTCLILLGASEIDIDTLLDNYAGSLKDSVIIPGFTSEPERFMAIADILVLPSYREGFGTVVIEAAAMEIPTIGTNIYGLSDAIVDGKTGLLVPVRDIDKLAEAISYLLKNDVLRCEMGANARRRVEEQFSDELLNELMLKEYERFLEVNVERE